ncbi:LysR family transcriptional regulator [Hypericibacter adhaerens]|jgi:DNA-binding transcriptional LysR family regulator|uniref:LysR family transcriptional regulator n=1 Tax=Hypericibacter adhaerens TaxID=2602016 RepID=A0A5J6MWR6_9PROT|nr:LysR family transcriptional regulator [Hypericibacter adhaerens]QEX21614.1 LysR family transcriptional regulator [Hypericibacter adhaerens]
MDRLESMSVIIAVAEAGGLSAASRKLGMPVPTVSRKLAELETRLNTRLFHRSPRQITLTDAGRSYIEACKRIVEQVEDAEREVSGEYRSPMGHLAATAPWGLGHSLLLPIACEFLSAYPDITLRLALTDRVLRPLEDKIDVVIRIGALADSSMIATRIGSVRLVACASPAYLSEHGCPKKPSELKDHVCITTDDMAAPRNWKFAKGKREIATPIQSRLTVNTSEAAVEAAVAGVGIARVMSYKMETARRAGKLAILLDSFEHEPMPVHILHAEQKPMPLKLRAFLNWVTPRLKAKLAQVG